MSPDKIQKIECEDAPKAIGPYSQAVSAGGWVFVSGQIPIDPSTGELSVDGIGVQTAIVIDNVAKILAECGSGLLDVVKVEVFLKDMKDFPAMNEVYVEKFAQEVKPARYVVQVARLPKDADIEVSCTAFRG